MLLRARYVFPVDGPPLADGVVELDGSRIAAVGRYVVGSPATDLGNVAILPGFVNPHTHLEFSDLSQPLGAPGMPFVEWIRAVLAHRTAHPASSNARALGVAESLRYGTTTVGDIASLPPAPRDWNPPPDATVFREIIAPRANRRDEALALCDVFFSSVTDATQFRRALSPHATYTVHRDVFVAMLKWAAKTPSVLIAMHLAESREELELLDRQRGPLHNLLVERGVWDDTALWPHSRPLNYLRLLAEGGRSLVIHGNYLDAEEQEFLACRASRMTVVYCPRTHAYFKHPAYPLAEMLARGVRVAVGTDSRASNPDLSVLAELRHVAAHHPAVPPEVVLRLGTINAAEALGLESEVGSLAPGKYANLAIVRLPDRDARNPHELLFDSTEEVVATYYRGEHAPGKPGG